MLDVNKFILITGGCGYIGSHVALLLKEKGFKIVVADNLSTGHRENMIHDVIYEIGDIGDSVFLKNLFEQYTIEKVIHLAAKTSVEESIDQPGFYYKENVSNSLILLEFCARYKVKQFIFSSTAAVYGESDNKPIRENCLAHPISVYGQSKYIAELIIKDVANRFNIKNVIFRYFNAAGCDNSLTIGNYNTQASTLIQKIARNIAKNRFSITVNGNDFSSTDGTCIRDYIHVMDIAYAHYLALEYLTVSNNNTSSISETFNIGYGIGLSVLDIINLFNKHLDGRLKYKIGPRRIGDIPFSVASCKKIKTILNWSSLFKNQYQQIIASELSWCQKLFSIDNNKTD
jgi:UDP-glucose 4-epimerase